ncbi:hypothetical protein DPQ33_08745 [Oceanidesulfovibrio indonesiensis]|uniref:Uncharacterized protein n=1 Tax=Oceanidesulfovibrio indonesiensis TaxID=54767 RepID=A0A7M3MFK3_9BACT|nr:hypothetical protein [Oceanidesulfovibrio indonesiensis]TVM17712.1 hypothetical protein DPQ33_08745 [Oceanidesulfovibrio indonesiensis]
MTPKRAQAWLNEVEAMTRRRDLLSSCQKAELQATHEAATALLTRAKLDAKRLMVIEGRVICKHDSAFVQPAR